MRKDGVPVGSAERLVWTLWLLQMLGNGSTRVPVKLSWVCSWVGVQPGRCAAG